MYDLKIKIEEIFIKQNENLFKFSFQAFKKMLWI